MASQTGTELQVYESAAHSRIANAVENSTWKASDTDPRQKSQYAVSNRISHEQAAVAASSSATRVPTNIILPKGRAIIVVSQLLGLQVFGSFCNGVIVVALPMIASNLELEESLLLWPTSVFYLTAGSCLLMAGSIADVIGAKRMTLAGAVILATSALACGLARTGGEIIAFRGLQGLSNAILVPSSISIISTSVENGRPRNIGFACIGLGGPLGFSLGLVVGGVLTDSTGWRTGFYLAAGVGFVLTIICLWSLPRDIHSSNERSVWKRLVTEVDWIGTTLASAGLAMLSYVLAMLSSNIHNIHQASNIALLIVSAATIPAFVVWMRFQVKNNRPALIPNSLWRNVTFTSICIMVLFITCVSNCMELFSSLFFQEVQGHSALGASLRILPALLVGVLLDFTTGMLVNRMPVMWTVLISSLICAVSPLLMAIVHPEWPYWSAAFVAQLLAPVSGDILFTVGLLVISDVFPAHMQAVGGAVFNTCAQLGTSIGLAATSVIATSTTHASHFADKSSPGALLVGYRACFWTMFAWMLFSALVCGLGLRRVGALGVKRD